jgi:hypothetical protein
MACSDLESLRARRRHRVYVRTLQDLSALGSRVSLRAGCTDIGAEDVSRGGRSRCAMTSGRQSASSREEGVDPCAVPVDPGRSEFGICRGRARDWTATYHMIDSALSRLPSVWSGLTSDHSGFQHGQAYATNDQGMNGSAKKRVSARVLSTNTHLLRWVAKMADLCKPAAKNDSTTRWCHGRASPFLAW